MKDSQLLERIAELEAKVWDAHLREKTLIRQLKNREEEWLALLEHSRKQEKERGELQSIVLDKDNEVKKLQYQVEQRDKTIAKAHRLLVLEKFYYPEKTTHFEESLKDSLA